MKNSPYIKVKKLYPDAKIPIRVTLGSSGLDLFAYLGNEIEITLESTPQLISTGIALQAPIGYDIQIRPRSGLASKGVGVVLGTIDSDYRGEIKVTMYMLNPNTRFPIKHGDRIAQLVISELALLPLQETQELDSSERGTDGHGSTGR